MMLDIYTIDRKTNERDTLLSCPLWEESERRELEKLKDDKLAKALVLNLFHYKERFYNEIYVKAYEAYKKGDEHTAETLLNEIVDKRMDFYNNFEERVGASANHFMKMKVYDFNIAPYVLLGYMKEVNWNTHTVIFEVTDDGTIQD